MRRAEIAALKVGDLHQNRGYDSLRVSRKGGRRDALAINPQTAARLRAYLELADHAADVDGPLFRPLKRNGKQQDECRHMDPDAVDRVVRKHARGLGLDRGDSAHSMRATLITTTLEKVPSSRTCRRPPGTGTQARPSSMISGVTTRKRRRHFLRSIEEIFEGKYSVRF
ncbi:MAG TPA: hypothetical protein VGJ20_20765 [Xanthobacteraceae bacterium]